MADFTLAPLLRKCSDDDLEPLVKLYCVASVPSGRTKRKYPSCSVRFEYRILIQGKALLIKMNCA